MSMSIWIFLYTTILILIILVIVLPIQLKNLGIEKVYYVNLDSRPDRRTQIEKELDGMGIRYERFPAIYDENGAIGCCKSHLAIIKLAKKNKYKNVLVFEDDFQFLVSKKEFYKNMRALKKIPFDGCLLAYNTVNLLDSPFSKLHKIVDAQTTSGYMINSHYYDPLIKCWETALDMFQKTGDWNYTCDQSWKELQRKDNWYCFKTRIGKQRDSYSNIEKHDVQPIA